MTDTAELTKSHKLSILAAVKATIEARLFENDTDFIELLTESLEDSAAMKYAQAGEGDEIDERLELVMSYAHDCQDAISKAMSRVKLDDVTG